MMMALAPGGNRNKGHDGEREVVKLLGDVVKSVLGESALRRNLQQTREGGHDIAGLSHLAIEVKRCETLEIDKWWKQTLRQAEQAGGAIPVLMYRQNRKAWNVVMFGRIGAMICRVTVDLATFNCWLFEDLSDRVRSGELRALSGFYEGDTRVVVEGLTKVIAIESLNSVE
jgi:Holliday junction resolvase